MSSGKGLPIAFGSLHTDEARLPFTASYLYKRELVAPALNATAQGALQASRTSGTSALLPPLSFGGRIRTSKRSLIV